MLSIYLVNLKEELDEGTFNLYMSYLPPERQKRIKAFLRREDSVRALVGQILSRLAIMKALNLTNSEIAFEANEYGKPRLMGEENYHYNISHSGDWVALAYDSQVVGIDVERIKDISMDIAHRFFSEREYKDLMSNPGSMRVDYFFNLWTLKESYIKALGKGLSQPLNSFSMVFEGKEIDIIFEDENLKRENAIWYFKQYPLEAGYKLSVCASHPIFPEDIKVLTMQDFYNLFFEWKEFWDQ